MAISTVDARALFTKTLVDVYQERIAPTTFLRSFFRTVTVPTKTIAIEVERMGEKIAVDVVRGTEGNRNSFYRSTEKIFEPPLFREYFDMTELDLYDRVLGSQGNDQLPLFKSLVDSAAEKLGKLQDKIDRSKEIQCAQVLETGIVTMTQGTNIDYKRKAASIVDKGAGNYWATGSVSPFTDLEAACNFLRKTGRSSDPMFIAILGSSALTDLLANTAFTARQNYFNMALDQVIAPERTLKSEGATFHGILTCGSYKVQLWAYPQFYDLPVNDASGNAPSSSVWTPTYTSTAYWNPKKVAVIPSMPRFTLGHCAVPRLVGQPGQLPAQGEYVMSEFLDERLAKHVLDLQSAPIAIPVAVDQIYTVQVVA